MIDCLRGSDRSDSQSNQCLEQLFRCCILVEHIREPPAVNYAGGSFYHQLFGPDVLPGLLR